MALSTAPSEPLDAVAEASDEADGSGGDGGSGRSSPGAAAAVSPFSATAFALEAMPPAESVRYPYGHAPEARPAGQTDSCCDESVKARPPRVMLESI